MEEIIDDIIDSIVDGVTSVFDSGDPIIDSAVDMIDGVSNSSIQSFVNGDFNDAGCDFSNLFDIDNVDSNIDSSQISFGSHIEDLYDPSIKTAQDNMDYHMHKVVDSQTAEDMEFHLDKIQEAKDSENYFKQCKLEAKVESAKCNAFLDEINEQWEIADRLQVNKEST